MGFAGNMASNLSTKIFSQRQLCRRGMVWREKISFLKIAKPEVSSMAVKVAYLPCPLAGQNSLHILYFNKPAQNLRLKVMAPPL
jgi:hypothetical protein